jgi:hypothetical protein
MTIFAWFARKPAETEKIFELEEFLRSVAMIEDNQSAPAKPAVPSEPPRPGLDERLDEALLETFPASDPIAVSLVS